jgi:hypothetical protein
MLGIGKSMRYAIEVLGGTRLILAMQKCSGRPCATASWRAPRSQGVSDGRRHFFKLRKCQEFRFPFGAASGGVTSSALHVWGWRRSGNEKAALINRTARLGGTSKIQLKRRRRKALIISRRSFAYSSILLRASSDRDERGVGLSASPVSVRPSSSCPMRRYPLKKDRHR